MMRTLWKMLGQPTLCGAALLAGATLAQAQGSLPPIPQPAKNQPTAQISVPDMAPGLGIPSEAPVAAPNNDDKARIERLEKQIQDLTNAINRAQVQPAQAP